MAEVLRKDWIEEVLDEGLALGRISQEEASEALKLSEHEFAEDVNWDLLQPILDKAQGVEPLDPEEEEAMWRASRKEHPLHRSDFT